MNRRNFILSTVVGVGVVSAGTYYFLRDVDYDPVFAKPGALSLIWDEQTIHAIGKQYRENFPAEDSQRSLIKLLEESPASELDTRTTGDFATGGTVLVDGWILSVTEARQCALASTL